MQTKYLKFIIITLLSGLLVTTSFANEKNVLQNPNQPSSSELISPITKIIPVPTLPASTIPMAKATNTLTPIPNKFNGGPVLLNQAVAIINTGVITSLELDIAVKQIIIQLKDQGSPIPSMLTVKRQVLQQLILKDLALQLAKKNNIIIGSLQIDQAIQGIISQNKVSLVELKQKLQQSGISYKAYRQNIKEQLAIQKIQQQAVAGSVFISPQEISQYVEKHQSNTIAAQYYVQHILLPLPTSKDPADVATAMQKADELVKKIKDSKFTFSDAATKYSQSSDALNAGKLGWKTADALPDIFAEKVVNMKTGEILSPFQAGGAIQILYLKEKKNKQQQQHFIKQYKLQQIVIKTSPIVNDQQAKAQLDRILNALKNGEKFAALAKSNSQNYDNANKGGSMGWVSLNNLPAQLATIVARTPTGKVTDLIQVGKSWQIIKIDATREKNNTNEFIKQQAMNLLFQQKAQQAVKTWMLSLKENAYVKILDSKLKMPEL